MYFVVKSDMNVNGFFFSGKQFGRLHNLQGHMHMHNDSKPYTCFCGSSFTLKGNMTQLPVSELFWVTKELMIIYNILLQNAK